MVNPGDTVVFTNRDSAGHTATANGGAFDTGILQLGQSASVTLTQSGTYSYFCLPHPNMKGTIVVR
jgi:plastocyanin